MHSVSIQLLINPQCFFADFDKIEPNWLLKANYYFIITLLLMIEQKQIQF